MKTYSIDNENNITAHATPEEAAAATTTPFDSFANQKELAELAKVWPAERLVAIWNSLPGVVALKSLPDTKAAKDRWAKRIWARIQDLGEAAQPEPEAAPKGKKSAKPKDAAGAPREGSKMAQVIALMQRKGGVTISEVMEKMGWQKHTVRGFVAGALKKAGYTVESFKPEGGERTYRIGK